METIKRATTKIVLDTRNKRSDETLPLKIRVTFERKPRVYGIKLKLDDNSIVDSLTATDFECVKKQKAKEPERFTEIREKLSSIQTEARDIIKKLEPFTFDLFRDRFTGIKKASDPGNVFFKYAETIKDLEANNQLGTASSYDLSLKSLKAFIKSSTGNEPEKLYFKDITVNWLRKYESYMISDKPDLKPDGTVKTDSEGNEKTKPGLTTTTVGIYLRPLRAIFNAAIEANEIEPAVYPFGKKKFIIPKGQKVKKALTKEQLKSLFNAKAPTPEQDKARDFWFFSYTCNGMNVKDICFLRNENMESDSLNFFREKTKRTTDDQHPVIVTLTEYAKSIIEKYRNQDTNPKAFVFPILSQTDSEITKRKKVQGFTSFINQQIKKLAGSVEITTDISTYFARHSWATLAIQGGASIEYVSEGLSHSDIKTTKGYFAGFADTTKKGIQESLMNFDEKEVKIINLSAINEENKVSSGTK
jgi:integrase/recombinase XerD